MPMYERTVKRNMSSHLFQNMALPLDQWHHDPREQHHPDDVGPGRNPVSIVILQKTRKIHYAKKKFFFRKNAVLFKRQTFVTKFLVDIFSMNFSSLIRQIPPPKKQDHLGMNIAPDLNNHLWSIDLFSINDHQEK